MEGRCVIQTPVSVETLNPDASQQLEELLPFTYSISAYRGRTIQERGLRVAFVRQAEPHPAARSPSDSYLALEYPFTSNNALREQYQRFTSPFLRVGLLLEDLDSLAADVATRHLGGLPPGYTVVTAAVDRIAFITAAGVPEQGASASAAAAAGADDAAPAAAAASTQQLPPGWGAPSQPSPLQQLAAGAGAGRTGAAADADAVAAAASSSSAAATQYPLSIYSDLRMVGQVCFAGRSSMEVLLELSTATPAGPGAAGQQAEQQRRWTPRAVAHFVMVLARQRDASQHGGEQQGPAWGVPLVTPATELERQHWDTAAARAAAHRAKRADSRLLSGVEPGPDEVRWLYELAERQLQRQLQQEEAAAEAASTGTSGDRPPGEPLAPVPIGSTTQQHLALMHSQDRNNANHIFGGHLLRLASELAYNTAVLHAGRHCEAVALGDVSFRSPVPIGCVLSMRAKVVHTDGHLLRVAVVASKHCQLLDKPSELQSSVTNDFVFVLVAVGSHPLRQVEPHTLRECIQFLGAQRQHLADGFVAPPLLLQPGMEHVLVG